MQTEIATDAELLADIERFCARNNLGTAAFGLAAIGDRSLVGNMQRGRSVTLKTANKLAIFMRDYRPTDTQVAA